VVAWVGVGARESTQVRGLLKLSILSYQPHMAADLSNSHAGAGVLQQTSAGFWADGATFLVKMILLVKQGFCKQGKEDKIKKKGKRAEDEYKIKLVDWAMIVIDSKNAQEVVNIFQAAPEHQVVSQNFFPEQDVIFTHRE
jgi:hypothetical protein